MAFATQASEEEITGINVTPLVDIVLVLLIIFMVTASFIVRETLEVDLPRAAHAGETLQGLVNVVLDKDGRIFFDGSEVNEAELLQRVASSVAQEPQARAVISADQALNYGRVMHVIDAIKGQGIAKFALNIQKDAAPNRSP